MVLIEFYELTLNLNPVFVVVAMLRLRGVFVCLVGTAVSIIQFSK